MNCKIYRVKGNRYSIIRKRPETLLKLVLENKYRELLIEVDESIIREEK